MMNGLWAHLCRPLERRNGNARGQLVAIVTVLSLVAARRTGTSTVGISWQCKHPTIPFL